jgi:DNA mismatch endonuclease, patch repair protein
MSHRLRLQTTPERSRLMASVRQTATWPEVAVQEMISSLGWQFTVKVTDLPGTPDVANKTQRWAIFVHGCYWHAHNCQLWKIPNANKEYWKEKFRANQERDGRKLKELRKLGYSCLTIWQCELRNPPRTKRKLLKFLSTTVSQNGHVKIPDASLSPDHVVPSYALNVNSQFVSGLLSIGGKSFSTATMSSTCMLRSISSSNVTQTTKSMNIRLSHVPENHDVGSRCRTFSTPALGTRRPI